MRLTGGKGIVMGQVSKKQTKCGQCHGHQLTISLVNFKSIFSLHFPSACVVTTFVYWNYSRENHLLLCVSTVGC